MAKSYKRPCYRRAYVVSRAIAAIGALLAVLALLRHILRAETASISDLSGGDAAHAVLLMLAGLLGGLLALRARDERLVYHGSWAVVALVVAQSAVSLWQRGAGLDAFAPPDTPIVASLALIGFCVLMRRRGWFVRSQMTAFVAVMFSVGLLLAQADGVMPFGAPQDPALLWALVLISAAGLLRYPHRGVLRAVLSPYATGPQARLMIVIGVAVPVAIHHVFHMAFPPPMSHGASVLMIATIAGVYLILLALTAFQAERRDAERRASERNLKYLAMRDPLTGVFNRVMLERHLSRAQVADDQEPLALLLIDLDDFKRVNDLWGHAFGDLVLRRVVRRLRAGLRWGDTLARIGGDEFAVLLRGTEARAAVEIAERLRGSVAQMRLQAPDGTPFRVTISAGLAQWDGGESIEGLFGRSDLLLYAAKSEGRDRVVAASPAQG